MEPGVWTTLHQFFPRRTELVEKHEAGIAIAVHGRALDADLPPLDCEKAGKLARPTLLVTGEQSPAMFLLITAELERCLEGESQVMVPDVRALDASGEYSLLQPGCPGLPAAATLGRGSHRCIFAKRKFIRKGRQQ